ncbi:selenocysteine-specific translation elongation factor [Pseudomonas sp. MAG002Y]|uniref:selenocysteine-specific translation elongation factor n=1 Tax=Pseudomonas sp. MAG002Y TaxID=2678690 RepID=UPI001C60BE7E|nr:selenocysteine-specific translation elongation factor [Pseudomonas sp. MAG002Y]MBW5411647.1 selenocysteine-specific translation elongation factor [Pseudomonas sp. MAG002Y]
MIVGTAGHIDHGKTSLIRALTGVEGDRRREEKERGITIDLGYVYSDLGNGELTGFIDVPGHERFVHNMLAGASGIDLVLLVVATDDGVMPQTREHLAIVELLGIRRAMVAMTKTDRVEAARVNAVREEIDALLADGPLAGAPVFPVSSQTGVGIEALRAALLDQAEQALARSDQGYFRLAVDRVFSVSGAGVVVTGTAFDGRVAVGDELLLGALGRRVRVRGLHAQNREAQIAHAGQRVAVNLAGERLNVEQIRRGDWLLDEALYAPSTRVDIDLHLLGSEGKALAHWTPVHVHLGAQNLTGRVALLEDEGVLTPGGRTLAQLVLNSPLQAAHGDHLVLRDQSAQRTIGGGRVLDPFGPARNRRTPTRLAQLEALRQGSFEDALPELLKQADNGVAPAVLERQFNRPRARWQLPEHVMEVATRQGIRLFDATRWQHLQSTLLERLGTFHVEQPDELGPDRDRLRRFALPQLERPVFIALLESLMASSQIEASGPWLHLPGHRVRLTEAEEALKEKLWPLLEAGRFDPPWVRDLAREIGEDEAGVRHLLRKLARLGQLQQIVKDLFYPENTINHLVQLTLRLEREEGIIRAAAFRDGLGIGRKRTIQILEFFDRIGLTRRMGDERKIRSDSALAAQVEQAS